MFFNGLWTPACAGVTMLGDQSRPVEVDQAALACAGVTSERRRAARDYASVTEPQLNRTYWNSPGSS